MAHEWIVGKHWGFFQIPPLLYHTLQGVIFHANSMKVMQLQSDCFSSVALVFLTLLVSVTIN